MICIIADGREKIHPRVLDMLSVLGVYQEGIAKSTINEKPVHAHLYEVYKRLYIYIYIYALTLYLLVHISIIINT